MKYYLNKYYLKISTSVRVRFEKLPCATVKTVDLNLTIKLKSKSGVDCKSVQKIRK